LVFDVTSRDSFNDLDDWMSEIANYCPDQRKIALVANKIDRESERVVTQTEGKKFASKIQAIEYVEISALQIDGIENLKEIIFEEVASRGILQFNASAFDRDDRQSIITNREPRCS
jgi:GTPase Era involved in 16S rRNA processing